MASAKAGLFSNNIVIESPHKPTLQRIQGLQLEGRQCTCGKDFLQLSCSYNGYM
jgi:hypothetical protein